MKKRIACLLLALVMLVSLVPTAAVTAFADGAVKISEAGIKVIKSYMGFQKNAYETFRDSGVYKIGYGTPAIKGQTITEANADKLLRDELAAIDTVVSGSVSVALTQKQFDALVWFLYAEQCGSLPGDVVSAVNAKKTGSEFANALCTFDFKGGYPDTAASLAVLTRRMAVAAMYLNGTYSAANSGAFGYTVFNAGDGVFSNGAKLMVQVFQISNPVKINVGEPTLADAAFLGWYSGSSMVTGVGSNTSGKALMAGWQKSDAAEVAANYSLPAQVIYKATGTADTAFVNVVDDPATGRMIDVLKREATVDVVAEKIVGGAKWLKLSTGGWVKLCDSLNAVPTIMNGYTVTITDDYVNIRQDPDASAGAIVGRAKRGETRTIYMLSADGKWGYCSEGWIFLAYTTYSSNAAGSGVSLGDGVPGKVTGAASVNVRTAPGVYNNIATKLSEGTAIKVYEQTDVNGAAWGHIDQGWIYMGYVQLNQTAQAGATASAGSTVYVSSTVSLNVRSGPGTGYSKVGALKPGTAVVILQKRTVGGETWGLIDQGWINMNYVSMGATSGSGSSVYGVGGTVVNCANGVNIRSAAGTANALVGVAALGSRVTVTERVKVNGYYWGRIDRGWVCMDYIQLDREFVDPVANDSQQLDNVVASFEGYPAKTNTATKAEVRETASVHAKSLMALDNGVDINILGMTKTGNNIFGKVAIGSITGWINMGDAYNNGDVRLTPLNARVSAAKADAYELPSTRSKFYASLVKGTIVTVGNADGSGWALADGILWGAVNGGAAWIKLSDVSKFVDNALPTGITTLSGVGYMTGTVNAETPLFKDSNGNVDTETTIYTVVVGHPVNIQARNYKDGVTYGKITVGSVTGWIPMANVDLDDVQVQAAAALPAWTSAPASVPAAADRQIPAGTKLTIEDRILVADANEINYGIADIGKVYLNNDHSVYYYVRLDQGGLNNITAAASANTGNPYVVSGVVMTGTAKGELSIYEEAMSSNVLLKIKDGSIVTILNWKEIPGGGLWGKVQIGSIVGWVKVNDVSFANLTGTIAVNELYLYSAPNKASSVQILRENNRAVNVTIDTDNLFDGTTLWGYVDVNGKMGWVDLANLYLHTPGETPAATPAAVIATAKINSVNITVNANGEIKTLPKGTAVDLTGLRMDGGKAIWTATFGNVSGEIDMDFLKMNTAVATVISPSIQILEDLGSMEKLADLYRDEKITVLNFKAWTDGALYGEVAYGNTTGWIQLSDAAGNLVVALAPGSVNTSYGGSTAAPTVPTTPTTPAATSVPGYIVCANTVNVRSGAGVENPLVTTLKNGTSVQIYEQTSVLGKDWARIDNGWVCMDYVRLGAAPATAPTGSGVGSVSIMTSVPAGAIAVGFANQDVKIRSGSGLGYPEVASVKKGNSLVIYEKKLDGGMSWGRTDNGWVCISYLTITGIGTSPNATVSCSYTANVRSNANSSAALMAKVMVTSRVAVYETTAVGSETWGRTDLGWINMQYAVPDSAAAPAPEAPAAEAPTTSDTIITDSGLAEVG